MNKLLLTGTLLIGTSLGLVGFTQAANADDATKTESDITFIGGTLKINEAPSSITFGTHNLTSGEQNYSEVNANGQPHNSTITVGDYRGQTAAGWRLTAKLESVDFGGMDLSIHPKGVAGTDYATFTEQTLNAEEQAIAEVTTDKITQEKPETQFSIGANVHVPANIQLSAKQYKTTIDWNLQSAPQ